MPKSTKPTRKNCHFVGSSRSDLCEFPAEVKDEIGRALDRVQLGLTPSCAKPWTGEGSGVFELVEPFNTDTYRAVYVVRLAGAVYVLHAFQKKSTQGSKTPKRHIDLIAKRLKDAEAHHALHYGGKKP